MKYPSHPGELIRESIQGLKEQGFTLTLEEIASCLGISRKTLSALINCRQSISTEMAIRLSIAFKHTTPEFWLHCQMNYDLATINKTLIINQVTRIW